MFCEFESSLNFDSHHKNYFKHSAMQARLNTSAANLKLLSQKSYTNAIEPYYIINISSIIIMLILIPHVLMFPALYIHNAFVM